MSATHQRPSPLSSLHLQRLKREWLGNVRADVLAGVAVALALIPEAIAFALIAGVEPKVGLYASFTIAVTTSIFGGRPGMISAATGAMALLMVPLVAEHGLEYLFAATLLTGLIQVIFRLFRLSRYIKFVPRAVMTGFVNALAILIFMAQLPQLKAGGFVMYGMVAAGLGVIYVLPLITQLIPSPLVAIVALTALTMSMGWSTHTVGDMGELPSTLPIFHVPAVPFTLETLKIITPYAIAMAMVGLIESLLTASVVDEMTDSSSCKHSEAHGQGLANLVTGFFGGMAGCAMIGQSVINVNSGGRGRLSTFTAGVVLLFLIVILGDWVAKIPTGALIAVMITVSIGTFDWRSLKQLRVMPLTETIVMLGTVLTVVLTHDLSLGVLVGVLLSAIFFARSAEKQLSVEKGETAEGARRYRVEGELFFVSVEQFMNAIDLSEGRDEVELDFSRAHVWDASAVWAIDRVILKLRAAGVSVTTSGLNDQSAAILKRLSTYNEPQAMLPATH